MKITNKLFMAAALASVALTGFCGQTSFAAGADDKGKAAIHDSAKLHAALLKKEAMRAKFRAENEARLRKFAAEKAALKAKEQHQADSKESKQDHWEDAAKAKQHKAVAKKK